jgi:hypothetical protein
MFDQLRHDLALIQTRKFRRIDGPADAALRHAIEKSAVPFPNSYIQFVLEFGNAELFRWGSG